MGKLKIILLRHGQSQWNKENRFTGWENVPLSDLGILEAKEAGKLMQEAGLQPNYAFTSFLKRAIKTCWLALEEMDLMHIPVEKDWRLNEKHYGNLQGLNKSETAAKYGEEQVLLWRRAFDVAPPALDPTDPRFPGNQSMYSGIPTQLLPDTESLQDTIQRLLPLWKNQILPKASEHGTILITAHGNSLRGVVKELKGLTAEEILKVNIPTGIPYLFELDEDFRVIQDRYLIDEATLTARMEAVASQGKA